MRYRWTATGGAFGEDGPAGVARGGLGTKEDGALPRGRRSASRKADEDQAWTASFRRPATKARAVNAQPSSARVFPPSGTLFGPSTARHSSYPASAARSPSAT